MTAKRGTSGTKRSKGAALRFGPAMMARRDALAAFTEIPGQLTRRYLSPAHLDSMRQIEAWMVEAGMSVRTDRCSACSAATRARRPAGPLS
jgi:allantoate deiminase